MTPCCALRTGSPHLEARPRRAVGVRVRQRPRGAPSGASRGEANRGGAFDPVTAAASQLGHPISSPPRHHLSFRAHPGATSEPEPRRTQRRLPQRRARMGALMVRAGGGVARSARWPSRARTPSASKTVPEAEPVPPVHALVRRLDGGALGPDARARSNCSALTARGPADATAAADMGAAAINYRGDTAAEAPMPSPSPVRGHCCRRLSASGDGGPRQGRGKKGAVERPRTLASIPPRRDGIGRRRRHQAVRGGPVGQPQLRSSACSSA